MASPSLAPTLRQGNRISLEEIDAAVSARLGPTRIPGNSQPACFNRQIGMYLAARVGRYSTTAIGRFYNGRDHSTVCHGIQRIESLREHDPEVDALVSDLARRLEAAPGGAESGHLHCVLNPPVRFRLGRAELEAIAEFVAIRVCERLGREPQ